MADDDQERAREREAELEAEIDSEVERVGRDPDEVDEGSESLGTQSADSGTPREGEREERESEEANTNEEVGGDTDSPEEIAESDDSGRNGGDRET